MTGPIAIKVLRFQCPFCRRSWAHKSAAERHVGRCWLDPQNRACKTCRNHQPPHDGGPCVAGRPCPCNIVDEECYAGHDLSEGVRSGPRLLVVELLKTWWLYRSYRNDENEEGQET